MEDWEKAGRFNVPDRTIEGKKGLFEAGRIYLLIIGVKVRLFSHLKFAPLGEGIDFEREERGVDLLSSLYVLLYRNSKLLIWNVPPLRSFESYFDVRF